MFIGISFGGDSGVVVVVLDDVCGCCVFIM